MSLRLLGYSVLYLLSSGLSYIATRQAIHDELKPYIWAEQGIEVPKTLINNCYAYCRRHKEDLSFISPLACTCTGGQFVRF